ncbi:hypothetical protein Aduo_008671 [Ancylostoma duodenale]
MCLRDYNDFQVIVYVTISRFLKCLRDNQEVQCSGMQLYLVVLVKNTICVRAKEDVKELSASLTTSKRETSGVTNHDFWCKVAKRLRNAQLRADA